MKFAVQLYSVRDHIKDGNDMLEVLGKVKEIGFDGVEFAGYFGLEAEVLRAKCEELGLEVVGSHMGLDDFKPENLDKTLAYGKALGAKYLGVGGAPHSTYEEAKNTGDVLSAARIGGIMACKKTAELIPLCHNIPIESVEITFENNDTDELYIYCTGKCSYKTGIEMEALTGASVAALTVYDMCKAIDRKMEIREVKLLEKSGGKSDFKND